MSVKGDCGVLRGDITLIGALYVSQWQAKLNYCIVKSQNWSLWLNFVYQIVSEKSIQIPHHIKPNVDETCHLVNLQSHG